MLNGVAQSASRLIAALGHPALVEILGVGSDGPLPDPGKLQALLVDVRGRAQTASNSSLLVTADGRTRAGRSRATPREPAMSAQTYCALFIAETWKYFWDAYPPPRNRRASQAAEEYWRLAGGDRLSWGNDPLSAWRRHFMKASKDQSEEANSLRAKIRRDLREAAAQAEALELADGPGI